MEKEESPTVFVSRIGTWLLVELFIPLFGVDSDSATAADLAEIIQDHRSRNGASPGMCSLSAKLPLVACVHADALANLAYGKNLLSGAISAAFLSGLEIRREFWQKVRASVDAALSLPNMAPQLVEDLRLEADLAPDAPVLRYVWPLTPTGRELLSPLVGDGLRVSSSEAFSKDLLGPLSERVGQGADRGEGVSPEFCVKG